MLKFWSVINCIFVHWTKKLTLVAQWRDDAGRHALVDATLLQIRVDVSRFCFVRRQIDVSYFKRVVVMWYPKIPYLSIQNHLIHQIWLAYLHSSEPGTTDTQWRHKSKISEKLGRSGWRNMLWPYLKIWEWEWIFGRAVKAISSLGVRSPWE